MSVKKPTTIALLVALAAALAMAISASSASAVPCTVNIICSGGGAGPKIRDEMAEPPAGGGYGAEILAVNTKGPLRLQVKGEKGEVLFENQNGTGYAFFGVKVAKNPTSEAGAPPEHAFATGWVTFADFENATKSPVYTGNSPSGKGAWPLLIKSSKSATNPNQVTIENVRLFFSEANQIASGTITGLYEQPGENCAGGGVKLDLEQPGLGAGRFVNNGGAGNAFICFVSSNNVLFPTTAPTWTPLTGSIWHD